MLTKNQLATLVRNAPVGTTITVTDRDGVSYVINAQAPVENARETAKSARRAETAKGTVKTPSAAQQAKVAANKQLYAQLTACGITHKALWTKELWLAAKKSGVESVTVECEGGHEYIVTQVGKRTFIAGEAIRAGFKVPAVEYTKRSGKLGQKLTFDITDGSRFITPKSLKLRD